MPPPEVLEIYQGQNAVGHNLLAAEANALPPHEKRKYMELVRAYESIATPKVLQKLCQHYSDVVGQFDFVSFCRVYSLALPITQVR